MKLFVNSKETDLPENSHLRELANLLQLPEKGVAVAVNNKMVFRNEWENHMLKENDRITIIKAACGG